MPTVIGAVELPEPDEEPDELDELHPAMTRATAATPAVHRAAVRLLGLGLGFPWNFMAINQPPDLGRRTSRLPPRLAGRTCRMPQEPFHLAAKPGHRLGRASCRERV